MRGRSPSEPLLARGAARARSPSRALRHTAALDGVDTSTVERAAFHQVFHLGET
jgi:hypothetical protein